MRLKKLIVQGFKSFADRTEFLFETPITGIVGPNGCGKSNVVDAFKWVLGEQSAKSLRGEAMHDVIFNGAATRKPSGLSEVVLVFDNPHKPDGTRHLNLDTDEVHVGRRLFRDGGSEYQLNGQPSRLRDIRELFLDTGIGVDAYSVIEQGKISALLEANPSERRVIFEEAAGISKFKAKKKETQRKLEKVQQNLLRVNDIVQEVDRRLRSVRIQAGRARTYKEHTERLAELRLSYSLQEYHTITSELAARHVEQQRHREQAAGLNQQVEARNTALTEQRRRVNETAEARQRVEHDLIEARSQVDSARQRQGFASEQLQQLEARTASARQQLLQNQSRHTDTDQALTANRAEHDQLGQQLAGNAELITEHDRRHRAVQHDLLKAQSELDSHKSAIMELMRAGSQIGNQLSSAEVEHRNASQAGERYQARAAEIEQALTEQTAAEAALVGELDACRASIADAQDRQEQRKAEAAEMGRRIAELSEQMGAAREQRSALLSRQKLLADLEARREGIGEGVKQILRQRDTLYPFIVGLVADVMRVDVEHAHIIEAALDGRDQVLLSCALDQTVAAADALDELESRVAVLHLDRLATGVPAYDWNVHPVRVRFAADLVRVEPEYRPVLEHLLSTTLVVENLADAHALLRDGPAGYRFVTADGEVLEADGTLRAGAVSRSMGILSRRSELEALAIQLQEIDQRIAALSEQINASTGAARELEEALSAIRNEMYQLNGRKIELTGRHTQLTDRIVALRREQPVVQREAEQVRQRLAQLEARANDLRRQRADIEARHAEHEKAVAELSAGAAKLQQQARELAEALTAARIAQGQLQEKQLALRQHIQRLEQQLREAAQAVQRLQLEIEQATTRQAELESDLAFARDDEAAALARIEQLTQHGQELADALEALTTDLRTLEADVDQLRRDLQTAEQALHHVDMQIGQMQVRVEGLVQRTRDELGLDLPERYAQVVAEQGGYSPGEVDYDAIAEEIRQLREKIQRLGNVNLDSISEQDELEQRSTFLNNQVNDLTTSRLQLEELIAQINEESGLRFAQCFEAVREHFQGMFRRLFGGGKADLILETELPPLPGVGENGEPLPPRQVDPLDAGIEIIARPPGKQPASISQLSGGEKAMTCVALLLSIFKSKPSPFCILDEVDAPLDEANNMRFNEIIREFTAQSQFIVITHSKRTMQIAEMLYGVTMQEQGVSKRVAVHFDQVDAQGRINETAAA